MEPWPGYTVRRLDSIAKQALVTVDLDTTRPQSKRATQEYREKGWG